MNLFKPGIPISLHAFFHEKLRIWARTESFLKSSGFLVYVFLKVSVTIFISSACALVNISKQGYLKPFLSDVQTFLKYLFPVMIWETNEDRVKICQKFPSSKCMVSYKGLFIIYRGVGTEEKCFLVQKICLPN